MMMIITIIITRIEKDESDEDMSYEDKSNESKT